MIQIHHLNLGTRLEIEDTNRLLHEYRQHPVLLAVLSYIRDEAMTAIGESTDALANGNQGMANFALGAHERLVQVLVKLEKLRQIPPELSDKLPEEPDPEQIKLRGTPEIEAM